MPGALTVTFQFSRECPSHERGLAELAQAAEAAAVELTVEPVEVAGDEQARELGFAGSPTYLVAGRDLFPVVGPAHAAEAGACRIYALPDGRMGPLPHPDDLAAALRTAAAAASEVPA
ncbi:MAG: thioredoxin family protein [Thermoleophilia bacterium]